MSYDKRSNNPPPGSRAIILTRVSTDEQEKNTSHEAQLEAGMSLVEREGWTFYKHYQESESGALYHSREKTQQALEDLEANRADVLVLYNSNRYGRDVEYQFRILRRILEARKWIQFTTFRLEYDENHQLTPESEVFFTMMAGVSSSEKKEIIRRLRSGRMKKIAAGESLYTFRVAFGYYIPKKVDLIRGEYPPEMKGKYILVPDKARIAEQIFRDIDAGYSSNEVCSRLFTQGILSPSGKRVWRPKTIQIIIENPIYKGQPEIHRKRFTRLDRKTKSGRNAYKIEKKPKEQHIPLGTAPAIVSEELWERCQVRLKENRRRAGRPDRRYMMTGLVYCPLCGRSMRSTGNQREISYFACPDKDPVTKEKLCIRRHYRAATLEAWTIRAVLEIASRPEIMRSAEASVQKKAEAKPVDTAEIKKRIAQLRRLEEQTIVDRVEAIDKGLDGSSYKAVIDKYSRERRALEIELARHEADAPVKKGRLQSPVAGWQKAQANLAKALQDERVLSTEKNKLLFNILRKVVPNHRDHVTTRKPKGSPDPTLSELRVYLKSPWPGREFLCIVTAKDVTVILQELDDQGSGDQGLERSQNGATH